MQLRWMVLPLAIAACGAQATEPVQVGRYSTLAPVPTVAQADPLASTVQVNFPAKVQSVGAAAEYLLSQSGYRLAAPSTAMRKLLAQPLPGSQRTLGPLSLTQALETLAGQPYTLRVDPVNRLVAFDLRPEFLAFLPPEPVPAAPAVAAAPAAVVGQSPQPATPAVPPASTRGPAPAAPAVTGKPWRPAETDGGTVVPVAADQPAPFEAPQPVTAAGGGFDIVAGSAPAARDVGFDIVAGHGAPPTRQQAGKDRTGKDRQGRAELQPQVVATATPVPVAAPAAIQPLVRLGPGTLSVLLDAWLRDKGWVLVWKSGADFRVDVPFSVDAGSPADPVQLMAALSGLYGVPHCAFPANRTIVVLQPGTDLRQECRP